MRVKDTKQCRHKFIHSEHYWSKKILFFRRFYFCVGVHDKYSWVDLPSRGAK